MQQPQPLHCQTLSSSAADRPTLGGTRRSDRCTCCTSRQAAGSGESGVLRVGHGAAVTCVESCCMKERACVVPFKLDKLTTLKTKFYVFYRKKDDVVMTVYTV